MSAYRTPAERDCPHFTAAPGWSLEARPVRRRSRWLAALRVAVLLAAFFVFGGGALAAAVLYALGRIGP